MNYAVINSEIVINIIVADENYAKNAKDLLLVPLQEGFGIGDHYKDGTFEHANNYFEEVTSI